MAKGGARPGAGRKRKDTATRQESNLAIVLSTCDREAVRGMVASMVAKAQEGDVKAFQALAPYLLGSPTQRHEVTGQGGEPLVFTLHIGDAEPTG